MPIDNCKHSFQELTEKILPKYMKEMKIEHSRAGKRKQLFIDALRENEIIQKTEPNIDVLAKIRPALFEDQILHIYVRSTAEAIDQEIKSVL